MPRAIWKGAINFGLVTIPVGLYTATDNKTPKFKQLRKTDHSAIKYQRVAEADGSRDGLPAPADKPEQFGPGIKRLLPKNY